MSNPTDNVAPVSVVIPAHNREELVGRAVASALAQQPLPPAEVIVIDDGSSDKTAERAAEAGAVVIRNETSQGSGPARNAGIEKARSEFIAFLDSDDEWLPTHLKIVMSAAAEDVVLVCSSMVRSTVGGEFVRVSGTGCTEAERSTSPSAVFTPENRLDTSTALVRTNAATAAGGFRPIRRVQDLDFWIRIAELGDVVLTPEVTAIYYLHDSQASSDRVQMRTYLREVIRGFEASPWFRPSFAWSIEVVSSWDELRAGQRSATSVIRQFAQHPLWSVKSLVRLLAYRKTIRKRTDDLKRRYPNVDALRAGAGA
jgi:glycosyltransferase involved in cell wall biosynthesis